MPLKVIFLASCLHFGGCLANTSYESRFANKGSFVSVEKFASSREQLLLCVAILIIFGEHNAPNF